MLKRFIPISFLTLFVILVCSAQDDPTVYVTRTGSKYHNAGCSYLKSSIPMKLSEAATRYTPCSRCNPPILSQQKSGSVSKEGSDTQGQKQIAPGGTVIGTTPTGKTIYEGPRGGHYHYSAGGKKVYERKKH
jgi:hypothetical protein